jgi:hypothetical protein
LSRKATTFSMNRLPRAAFLLTCFLFIQTVASAQDVSSPTAQKPEWYQRLKIRGYAQLRYNKLYETNPDLKCEQCDKSWGGDNGFFFRRIRIIFYGQVHERVFVYIQPDFASSPDGRNLQFAQIRDAYFDVGIDKKNEFRFRIGQSKVPFGFENLQSSQNRTPLDRNDGLNSAVANERDIGIFFYWAPRKIRERFSDLVNSGLKGSGDYGVVGFGVHNGQTANRPEGNSSLHTVARISFPFLVGSKQFIEPGIQAYTGKNKVASTSAATTGVTGTEDFMYDDQRIAATLVVYPQPFGLTAEYNIGTGPEYNPVTNVIEQQKLKGGYIMASYMARFGNQILIPFSRYHYYDGGKKHELDARSYSVKELEIGIEWQPIKNFELVAMYTISQRRFEDAVTPVNFQEGSLIRIQLQANF